MSARSPDVLGLRFNLAELSGSLADLGVLLPLTLALITLNGVNATSAFVVIGLAYLLNAFVYRLPIPVQPLKSLSATALALGLSASVVTAGAWWMALILIVLAIANAAPWIGRLFPKPIVRGIQLGLALLLINSAWTLWQPTGGSTAIDVWLIGGGLFVLGAFLVVRHDWAALGVIELWRGGGPHPIGCTNSHVSTGAAVDRTACAGRFSSSPVAVSAATNPSESSQFDLLN